MAAPTRFVAADAVVEEYDMTPSGVTVETENSPSEAGYSASLKRQEPFFAPANKKPKTVLCYSDVDLGTWTTKVKGKNTFGSPTVLIIGEDGAPRMALFRRDEPRGMFPFKLDLEPANGAQMPAFLSGKPTDKTTEGLDLQITLTQDQIDFLGKVDDWAQQQALANSKDWFGKVHTEAEIAAMYTPCLKRDKEDRYPPKFKSKLILAGFPTYFTKVIHIASDNTKKVGAGWDFVKPLLGANAWRGNEVRAVIEFRRVWVVGKKFGIGGAYTDLVVVEKEKGATDVDFPELDLA